jgi:hypothetical protein
VRFGSSFSDAQASYIICWFFTVKQRDGSSCVVLRQVETIEVELKSQSLLNPYAVALYGYIVA